MPDVTFRGMLKDKVLVSGDTEHIILKNTPTVNLSQRFHKIDVYNIKDRKLDKKTKKDVYSKGVKLGTIEIDLSDGEDTTFVCDY